MNNIELLDGRQMGQDGMVSMPSIPQVEEQQVPAITYPKSQIDDFSKSVILDDRDRKAIDKMIADGLDEEGIAQEVMRVKGIQPDTTVQKGGPSTADKLGASAEQALRLGANDNNQGIEDYQDGGLKGMLMGAVQTPVALLKGAAQTGIDIGVGAGNVLEGGARLAGRGIDYISSSLFGSESKPMESMYSGTTVGQDVGQLAKGAAGVANIIGMGIPSTVVNAIGQTESGREALGAIGKVVAPVMEGIGSVVTGLASKVGLKFDNPEEEKGFEQNMGILATALLTKTKGTKALESAESAKNAITESIAGIDDATKTALGRTAPEQVQKITDQVKASMSDDRIPSPLAQIGRKAETVMEDIATMRSKVGQEKSALLPVDAQIDIAPIANKFDEMMAERGGAKFKLDVDKDGNVTKANIENAEGRVSKLSGSDTKILSDMRQEIIDLGNNPTAQMVDDIVDKFQGMLYKSSGVGVEKLSGPAASIAEQITGELNESVKKIAPPEFQAKNTEYARLSNILDEFEKRFGSEGQKGASVLKQVFSPVDNNTKNLLEQIREVTGTDFISEARVAKFVSEALGDTKASNLLEEVQKFGKEGVIGSAIGYGKKLLVNPAKEAVKVSKRSAEDGVSSLTVKHNADKVNTESSIENIQSEGSKFNPLDLSKNKGGFIRNPFAKESLMDEAKKYKNSNEFIKAQGEPLYHGSDAAGIIDNEGFKLMPQKYGKAYGEGIYLSDSKSDAGKYVSRGKNDELINKAKKSDSIEEFVSKVFPGKKLDEINPGTLEQFTKLFDESRQDTRGVLVTYIPKDAKLYKTTSSEVGNIDVDKLKSKGYIGIEISGGTAKNFVIFDPSNIKTKNQLSEIYSQSKK